MISVSNLCKCSSYTINLARLKSKTHWAKLRKKTGPKYKALQHFDDFYGSVFGKQWETMKEALLRRSKYVALINNYGDAEKTMEFLSNRGAHCLQNLFHIQTDFNKQYKSENEAPPAQDDTKLQQYISKISSQDISSIYPNSNNMPGRIETSGVSVNTEICNEDINDEKSKAKTLDESLAEAEIDQSRYVDPSIGLTSDALYQYVPATKIKGMDDWLPESLHYSYYSKGQDFPLLLEPETEFKFPEHLKVYTYEKGSEFTEFPEPKRCTTGVFNYYPLDCGSVLPVLSLCLAPGDRVLDLCAAPGGKTLLMLQTLLPDVLVCNDSSISRNNRLGRVLKDYIFDFEKSNKWRERVVFKQVDGRILTDDVGFDKVLVDVPCTTDRHSVNEDENNIFRPDRIKERLKIPELQAELLANALCLVRVGGAVVYSTCSLSPIQNDGVVHMALKTVFERHGIIASIRDLTPVLKGFTSTLNLGVGLSAPKYGHLVTPSISANFGPSYFARIVRVK